MNRGSAFLTGAGLGAGLMYVLDPETGRRRRALARDKVTSVVGRSDDALAATATDMANRARGLFAEARALFEGREVPDDVLAARVRSELGHWSSHPGAIEVSAGGGRVTLAGPILTDEVEGVLRAVRGVRGVREVENRLEVHREPGNVPALQGGVGRTGRRPELLQTHWSPTARVLVGTTGAWLAIARPFPGLLSGLLGAAMLTRAATNRELGRLLGVARGRRGVDVQKSLTIGAPVATVFELWRRYENFPQFMTDVREVRELGEGRSHWVVAGPGGVPIEWDAEVTRLVPNEVLAWKSVPGSPVQHAGIVRFEPSGEAAATVHVRMSYSPPAGALGHGVAALVGADPKSRLDQDLMRMKTLLETGKAPRDAAAAPPPPEVGRATP